MEDCGQIEGIFTRTEALNYLTKQLDIIDAAHVLTRDPLALLEKLSIRYTERVPFQNITILSSPIGTIDVPSLDQIKSDHLSGRGGLCYGHNRFFCELLCALGYKAHMASGQVTNPDGHLVVIVDAMPNGDTGTPYFVDNGFGIPHHRPVPLDFETESPVYNLGHSIFKITREGELYTRWSAKQGTKFLCASEYEKGQNNFEWKKAFTFTTKPNTIANIVTGMDHSYKIRFGNSGTFLFALIQGEVVHYVEDYHQSTPEMDIKYHKMSPSGTVTTRFGSVDDIVSCLLKLSSVFSEEELRTAMMNMAMYKKTYVEENNDKCLSYWWEGVIQGRWLTQLKLTSP